MGSGNLIKAAIAKYGIENFKKEILHVFDNEQEMNEAEKRLVVLCEESYNICTGGKGGFGYINKNGMNNKGKTPERIREISRKGVLALDKLYGKGKRPFVSKHSAEMHSSGKMKSHYWGSPERKESLVLAIKKRTSKESISKQKNTYAKIGHQQGSRNSQFGTIWITDGVSDKKINPSDLERFESLGFRRGRKF